jgi:hypothetical protein
MTNLALPKTFCGLLPRPAVTCLDEVYVGSLTHVPHVLQQTSPNKPGTFDAEISILQSRSSLIRSSIFCLFTLQNCGTVESEPDA